MILHAPYTLDTNDIIKEYCQTLLDQQWDYKSSMIFRISMNAPFMDALNEEMLSKGLSKIRLVSIFCRGPYDRQVIHQDASDDGYTICPSGFYIPLINVNSKLVWFDPDKGVTVKGSTPQKFNSNDKASSLLQVIYDKKQSYVIGEYSSDEPSIINTAVPHRAESENGMRAAIAIRLQENVDLFKHFNLPQ